MVRFFVTILRFLIANILRFLIAAILRWLVAAIRITTITGIATIRSERPMYLWIDSILGFQVLVACRLQVPVDFNIEGISLVVILSMGVFVDFVKVGGSVSVVIKCWRRIDRFYFTIWFRSRSGSAVTPLDRFAISVTCVVTIRHRFWVAISTTV